MQHGTYDLGRQCGVDKGFSIKSDAGSSDSKQITLRVKFDGVTLLDVFNKALSQAVIQWQNGPGRKKFTTWTDKSIVDIDFKAPARTTVDPEAEIEARLRAMQTVEEREAYLRTLLAKVQ